MAEGLGAALQKPIHWFKSNQYLIFNYTMQQEYDTTIYKDEHAIRIVAAEVAVLTMIALIFGWSFPAFLLVGDFALRTFTRQASPLSAIADTIAAAAGLQPRPIFAAPKKFAALLGFMFSVVILISLHYNLATTTYVAGSLLFVCATLEAAFNICIGCYVYSLIVVPFINYKQSEKTGKD